MLRGYTTLYIIDIVALFFLFALLHNDNFLIQHRKQSFSCGIIFTVLIILAEIGTRLVSGGSAELRGIHILFNVFGFALTPLVPISLAVIFDTQIIKKHKWILLPTILNAIVVMLSPWFGLIFYVDANNIYQRGSVFFLFVGTYIINIVFLSFITLYTGQKYFYPIKWKMASLTLFVVVGTCIQLIFPTIYSSWHCVTCVLLLFYLLLSEFEGSFDPVTELYNRAAFEKAITKLKDRHKFTFVIMDINNFKEINDTYGHEYGDTILKEVAQIIRSSFDLNCCCYRIGGDELCAICRDIKREKLDYQLKTITENLAKKHQTDRSLPTVAYGYSIFDGDRAIDFKKIFEEADQQMYSCKKLQKEKTTT